MTDNPGPKGKGISSRFSGILRRSTRSTSDLTSIHAHDISSVYPSERKAIKKSKNNGSNDSISMYGSDDSDQKPRKISNVQSAIPAGSTQEAVADATLNIESISEFSHTPSPTRASRVASPKVPLIPPNTGNPPVTMIVSSSQESEQIRDAGEGFERLMEHTSDYDDSQVGTPKSIAMDLAEDTRPMSATPKSNRISNVRRETPMHDLTWNPEDQHWLDRLEDGAYPCDDALECALKYSQITAKVIRSIINNRVTQDRTTNEQNTTIKFLKDIAKISESTHDHADRTSHIYPQCIREGRPMKPEPVTSLVDNEEMETDHETDWGNSKPGKGWGQAAHHPQPTNPFIDFDPTSGLINPNPNTPSTLSTDNPILNQILKKLEQLDNINTRLSRLEGSKPQAKPAHTTQPASAPKPNQNTSNSASVSWADVAAKGNSKAPEVKASNIASALKRDIAKPSPAQSDDRNFVVRFKTLPVTQPNPESIFVSMRECLDAANRTLGKGRLTRVRWTLKASLHLSFSNSASITAIENAIPLLMDKLKMPEYDFGPEVPWSRLVVTNVPTGMGGPAQRMRNRDELTQLLRDSFPEEAKFGDLKITLSPDWLADPARLQAEGRQASTVSFAFEDAGGITSSRLLANPQLFIYGRKCEIKKFNPKPLLQTCSKCVRYGHTERQCRTKKPRCHKCGRNTHTTEDHNADNCPRCIRDGKGNPCECVYCTSCSLHGHRFNTPECPKMSEFRRPITQIIASRSTGVNA
ncbi:hypothetical protein RhiXN_11599 [Rhizoctonia solani]|uniref:Uncharacterized protein n=1 Tax=Rhizoctonia solani TaxID=456999 RepID=A0A8H8T1F0_9AGAM|nr:uncharacterized protein RhiXN_11599 [Rhizoctonia solani]QRW24687.1 hypothetical protein RhiXN_11599 [Rhizoctonia solani]